MPQSHDCWHRGQRARGTKSFPSLAFPHNLGSAKDNRLPGNAAGQAETGLPQVSLLQLAQHPRGCDLHPPWCLHTPRSLSADSSANLTLPARSFHPPQSWGLSAAVVAAGAAQHPALPTATVGGGAGERLQGSHSLAWLFWGDKGRLCLHAAVWTNAGHGSCHPRKSQTWQ